MKSLLYLLLLFALPHALGSSKSLSLPHLANAKGEVQRLTQQNKLQNGDLIFQSSVSPLSKAIQLATHSKYSHCGIIYFLGGQYFVLEAIQPVSLTPLSHWISRGSEGHYVIKRLKNSALVLTRQTLDKILDISYKFIGKDYDGFFEWSDERIYCSELIWKIYQRAAGIEIGKRQKLREFDLSSPLVKKQLRERYREHIPLDEWVISPVAMMKSPLLITID